MKRGQVQFFRETVRSLHASLLEVFRVFRGDVSSVKDLQTCIENVDDALRLVLSTTDSEEKHEIVKSFLDRELPLLERFQGEISKPVRADLGGFRLDLLAFLGGFDEGKRKASTLTFSEECIRRIDIECAELWKTMDAEERDAFKELMRRGQRLATVARFDAEFRKIREYREAFREMAPPGNYSMANDDFRVMAKKRSPIKLPPRGASASEKKVLLKAFPNVTAPQRVGVQLTQRTDVPLGCLRINKAILDNINGLTGADKKLQVAVGAV